MTDRHRKYGFTLLEAITVVGIVAVLAGFLLMAGKGIKEKMQIKCVSGSIRVLGLALEQYYQFTDSFPDPEEAYVIGSDVAGLSGGEILYKRLFAVPDSRRICEDIPVSLIGDVNGNSMCEFNDVWDNAMRYEYEPGDNFPVTTSAGLDGLFGTDDDITSR